jgi:hypothetical protein
MFFVILPILLMVLYGYVQTVVLLGFGLAAGWQGMARLAWLRMER